MKDKQNQEVVIQAFNALRNEQRSIATKTNELQQDLNEHKIVIETLDGVSGDRKCFRYLVFHPHHSGPLYIILKISCLLF